MKWADYKVFNISLRFLIALALFLGLLMVFALLVHEVIGENEAGFDNRAFAFFKSYSSPDAISFFRFITFFGSTNFLFPAYFLLIGYLLLARRRRDAINVTLMAGISTLMMYGFKELFARKRPDLPLVRTLTNYSFPSGHALSSFVFCSVLIWLISKSKIPRWWKVISSILFVLLALAIGVSRIVLRYHYATDVIAGFCLGAAWVMLYLFVSSRVERKTGGSV